MSLATLGVEPRDAGVASAMVNTSQQVGGAIGTALLNTIAASATTAYVKDHIAGAATQPQQQLVQLQAQVHGYTNAIWFAVGILVVAARNRLHLHQRRKPRRHRGRGLPRRRRGRREGPGHRPLSATGPAWGHPLTSYVCRGGDAFIRTNRDLPRLRERWSRGRSMPMPGAGPVPGPAMGRVSGPSGARGTARPATTNPHPTTNPANPYRSQGRSAPVLRLEPLGDRPAGSLRVAVDLVGAEPVEHGGAHRRDVARCRRGQHGASPPCP